MSIQITNKPYQTLTQLTVVIILLGCMFSCSTNKKQKADSSIPPKFAVSEPQFVKQGELFFISETTDTLALIDIEKADNLQKIETGLMHRRSMNENEGMLFLFEDESRRSFWMKNTHIALDILFVNSDKEIVHIAPDNAPYSMKPIHSIEYAKYVVEVNGGFCEKNKITTGDEISFY